ncbi:hypothetical protein LLG96_05575 [bacterium]|nr:hypothetical protein [bacterium]
MHSAENIISRIIDLDSKAENIRSEAHAEAGRIKQDTLKRIEDEKLALQKQIAEKTTRINDDAARKRDEELDRVRKEYKTMAESVKNLPRESVDRSVNRIISRIKGSTP